MAAEKSSVKAEDSARTAGRGGLAVLGAKIFFIVTGFVQQPLLRLAVGLSDFGALAQALVVANTINNVVVATGTQGVSRIVAASPGHELTALRATMRVHVPLALLVAGLLAVVAPVYTQFERATDVVAPLLVLAIVAFLYGIYAPLVGYLNGSRRFGSQAALDVTFATLRTVGMVAVGHAFVAHGRSGVLGTTIGWVLATLLVVPIALRMTRLGNAPSGAEAPSAVVGARAYIRILLPIAMAQIFTNLLLQVDLVLLGRFLSSGFAKVAAVGEQRDLVKGWLGIYRECQTFAFLPYQLLFSVTLILFPMLARAHATGDRDAGRAYVVRAARLAAIFGGLLVSVLLAIPEPLLAFAYGSADAVRGAGVLRALAAGQAAFAMLAIATTVLTSTGRERTAATVTFSAFIAVALACIVRVPGAPIGQEQLLRTAQAAAFALWMTLLVAGGIVRSHTGAFVPASTGARVGLALATCFVVGLKMPPVGRWLTPLAALGVGAAYVAILTLTGELRGADLALLRGVASKSRSI